MKAVLITGAARRIGKAIALEFAAAGYDVALHYHHSEAEAISTQQKIQAFGRKCVLIQQDLNDLASLPSVIAQAKSAFPHLSVLVNNASTFRRISFANTTPESLMADFTTNFMQPFLLTQAFHTQIGEGAVINLLDISIRTHRTSHFAYLLAKKALAEFTLMAAKDLAPKVRVNAVAPAYVLPTEGDDSHDPNQPRVPIERVSAAVLALAENTALTGEILYTEPTEK
jgi:pteridine reductase